MSKASILRQLSDEDLETIHHMIRRDAMPDEAIAREASRLLKATAHGPRPTVNPMVVARYRQSAQYKKWLNAWENRDTELRKAIETQKQRFELISNLVRTGDSEGFETVSKSLQARLLTLAAEADDQQLKDAAGGKGWVCEALKLAQADVRDQYRRKVEELKSEITRLMSAPKGVKARTEDLVATVDAVMGIKG